MKGTFAHCIECAKQWTYEDMVTDFARKCGNFYCPPVQLPTLPTVPEGTEVEVVKPQIPKERMLGHIMAFQRNVGCSVDDIPVLCINTVYQQHASCHVKGCFKCSRVNKSTHTCGPTCECRFRLPDRPRKSASVRYIAESKTWFEWDGSSRQQPLVEILPKRGMYDLFQNPSCRAVSESKFSCNSNVSVVTDGPIGNYCCKYAVKDTKKDDQAAYTKVDESMKKMNDERIHDDDRKEALRRVARAAFANNKENVIGAPFASFLTRHDERFYFSHTFIHCPLRDIVRLLQRDRVSGVAKYNRQGEVYFENQALHYLCRPLELEALSVKEFYEKYNVVSAYGATKRGSDGSTKDKLPFVDHTGYFQHPSCRELKNGKLSKPDQAVQESAAVRYAKIPQWLFPDTADFRANILTCSESEINCTMEHYALHVLALFMPHRSVLDFKPRIHHPHWPYVMKLRDMCTVDSIRKSNGQKPVIFTDANKKFLQNLQNSAYNSLRYKIRKDDLMSVTHAFRPSDFEDAMDHFYDSDAESDDDDDGLEETPYEHLFQQLDKSATNDSDPSFLSEALQGFSFKAVRNRGPKKCGYNKEVPIPHRTQDIIDVEETWVERDFVAHAQDQAEPNAMDNEELPIPRMGKLVEVLLSKSTSRTRTEVFQYNPDASVLEANGSIESIEDWAKAAKLDRVQKRAFQCIVAAFILTFFDAADGPQGNDDVTMSEVSNFRTFKQNLLKLKGDRKSQLVCLMHGPGGSGKSTVINLTKAYAHEYCDLIGYPFSSRTMVITAMSGVAATLLHGETTHSALGLNKKNMKGETTMQKQWKQAKMVIIDEISFASERDFQKIYNNLQILMGQHFKPFGGINIVFAGDFSQLEPPGRHPVYKTGHIAEFHGSLTTFIELHGHHHFKDDPDWGQRLFRFRCGKPTSEDIAFINSCCTISDDHFPEKPVPVACYRNVERDAVNSAVFEEYCSEHGSDANTIFNGAIMVFMDDLQMMDTKSVHVPVTSNAVKQYFWSSCGEDSIIYNDSNRQRVDPTVKLYPGCPMMLTKNEDVPNGQANGSRVYVRKVHVHYGEHPMILHMTCGTLIRAYRSTQIRSIIVEHEDPTILPRTFEVEKETFTFKCNMVLDDEKIIAGIKGTQFPIISNTATTGHKLQGYTATALLVNTWHYQSNWAYVVLSRVRTMAKLYLLEELTDDLRKYEMPKEMIEMLTGFRDTLSLDDLDDDVIQAMINMEEIIRQPRIAPVVPGAQASNA